MKTISFYLLTDSHYVSKKTWEEGKPFTFRERSDQIALKATPAILDAFLDKIIADSDTDTVLFCGDNVNNADMLSHCEFRQRLEKLVNAGKRVYVIYATHDYAGMGDDNNRFRACRYTESGEEPIDAMRKSELYDYYYDFGPKQALSVHRTSGSYTVQLGDGVRLIAIIDNGNGGGYCGLDKDGMQWLKQEIKHAAQSGNYVVLAAHHPVLSPWEIYRHLAEHELYGGYSELQKMMCENSVRVIFTGHTHVQNIRKYTDSQGRWFYDVSTIALANAAGKMRRVVIDPDEGTCNVTSIGNEAIPFETLYHLNFPGIWEKLLPLAATDYHAFLALAEGYLPLDILKKHKVLIRWAGKALQKIKLSSLAGFVGCRKKLSPAQKQELKHKKLFDAVCIIFRHIYTGNAPFTPDTAEYQVLNALTFHADQCVKLLRIKTVVNIIPDGSSLTQIAQDFLYNCRTGNDDAVSFSLK